MAFIAIALTFSGSNDTKNGEAIVDFQYRDESKESRGSLE